MMFHMVKEYINGPMVIPMKVNGLKVTSKVKERKLQLKEHSTRESGSRESLMDKELVLILLTMLSMKDNGKMGCIMDKAS